MEYWILGVMWLFGIISFILFIPRKDLRKGILSLMIFSAIVWLCDMPAFKYNLLSAPVRIFPRATDLALTINYIFYPALFSIYYANKKVKRSLWSRTAYFFVWVSGVTLIDILLEKYTALLEYGFITWYGMWIYISLLFYSSQVCCNWFFKDNAMFRTEQWSIQ